MSKNEGENTMKRKIMKRIVSLLLAVAMTIGCVPLTSTGVFAAPASDIPAKMLNNHMLDALEYIGYKVQAQRDDGTLYKKIGGEATAYLSNVTYGQDSTAGNGLEVNSKGLPDIAYFEKYGMQCGSWATYYWFNYLPHVAGVDTSYLNPPTWPMNPGSWWERAQDWIKAGYAEEISFTVDWNTGKVVPAKEIPIGSIVLFANRETGSLWTGGHVSMYAGEYNGTQFLTHVGTSRGPEFHSINAFHLNQADKGGTKQVVSKIIAIKEIESPYGSIEIYKKDQNGKVLSGAEFTITNKGTGKTVGKGVTNVDGYYRLLKLPYGTYTVTETKFPTGYTSSGTTTWTVTISDSNKGKVVINAVNEPDTGKCKIVKTSEDNKISGVSFTITGNGVNKTVKTGTDGTIVTELKPGTYTVTETTPSYYETQAAKTVTVKSGATATVSFNNTIKKGSVKVTKTSEDGLVSGIVFKLSGTSAAGTTVNMTATTNASGIATFSNVPISSSSGYTLEEVNTAVKYIVPAKQNTVVEWNKVTEKSFVNTLKRGELSVTKTAEDGEVTNLRFHLYGTSLSGQKVDMYATTNANGIATFKNVLISGGSGYTLEEVDTAEKYIVPSSQNTVINWDEVTNKSFFNGLKRGRVEVTKTSEDGLNEGVSFHLYGTSLSGIAVDLYATTDSTGKAVFENVLISGENPYTLEEVNTAYRYVVPAKQNVVVEWNVVTKKSVVNGLKKGEVRVTKTSEDGLAEGIQFHLYGTSEVSGQKVDMYATTNSKGIATFKNVPIAETEEYTLEEVDTAVRYVVPKKQKVSVNWNEVTGKSVENTLKKFRVIINKTDSEYEAAQGDATLKGAVYGLYNDGVLVEEITTNANGVATSDYHVCGDKYFVQEIKASAGYLLDPKSYKVGESAKYFTIELNSVSKDVKEDVKKGKIAIIKHCDDGSTKIETPEAGATFMVYLKSAGSFLAAKETEKDVLVCDEDGFAITKDLPYGTYIVHQQNGWEGRELMHDFEVKVAENEKTYKYLINNAVYKSYLMIEKVDAESGKKIPYAGAGFRIYDPEGNPVEMMQIYPKPVVMDVFYTNDEGYLITPQTLEYGEGYSLVEVQAPYGYVLDSTPIYFDIKQQDEVEFENLGVIVVQRTNIPQKGIIKVEKTGEVFSSVIQSFNEDGEAEYTPVYEEKPLEGAVFTVIAAEDIVTPDGTIHHKNNDVVATMTTDSNGEAQTEELYLGRYKVVETQCPEGYILDNAIHVVELSYEGQLVSVTGAAMAVFNEKQTLLVSLMKDMEVDKLFDIGTNNEILDVEFGLYADETLTAADGSVIPEGALIKAFKVNIDGTARLDLEVPFGKYYVKEIKTNEAYILDNTKYEFEFRYAGDDVRTVNIILNDGKKIENNLFYGSIKGMKADDKGEPLAGAVFALFRADAERYDYEDALMTAVSKKDGSYYFAHVPCGEYLLVEIKAPSGYIIKPFAQKIVITKKCLETVEAETVYNAPAKGALRIIKNGEWVSGRKPCGDFKYENVKLGGATFGIYKDGELIKEVTTGEDGTAYAGGLDLGVYEVKEITAPEGYKLDDTVYTVEIKYANDKTPLVISELTVENDRLHVCVKVEKADSKTGDHLAGAEFGLYAGEDILDKDGKVIVKKDELIEALVTGKSGIITYSLDLPYGEFYIKEITAPEGYKLSDEVKKISKDDFKNQTLTFKIKNSKGKPPVEPPEEEPPKTGDSNATGVLGLVAFGSSMIAIGAAITGRRKKKEFESAE